MILALKKEKSKEAGRKRSNTLYRRNVKVNPTY